MASNSRVRQILASRWRAESSGPYFKLDEPSRSLLAALPEDYFNVIQEFGRKEGFLGSEYIHLYGLDELVDLNNSYGAPTFLPEAFIFGSDGCGEAYAFRSSDGAVIQIPFIPLIVQFAEFVAPTFADFIEHCAATGDSGPLNRETIGMEVHEKHPIALGGDPTDEDNKVFVPPLEHAELCRYWTEVYCRISEKQEGQR